MNAEKILAMALQHDLEGIIAAARKEIALEAAKTIGGATMAQRTKKAMAYIKACSQNPALIGTFTQHGAQCFLNGHTGFMLYEPLPGLPEATRRDFDLVKCFPDNTPDEISLADVLPAARQHIAELKAQNAGRKSKVVKPLRVGSCYYNAQYILDACAILGGNVRMYQNNERPTSPAVFESENGKAIALPVRPPQQADERKAG